MAGRPDPVPNAPDRLIESCAEPPADPRRPDMRGGTALERATCPRRQVHPPRPERASGVEDLDDVRECLSRLAFAFTGLLGNRPDPVVVATRLRELAGIAREIGELCDQRAAGVTDVEGRRR